MYLLTETGIANTITSVLAILKEVFTFLMEQIGTIVDLVMSQPLLLIPIGITVAFIVIRFFKSIFSLVR